MVEERVQRRLAAIMAADVVGYSRLIGLDETGTRTRFNSHLSDLIKPSVTTHRGRIVKTLGDGLLIEFPSIVDATECAIQIQKGMADRTVGEADSERIQFRIAVHLGDVIVEDDDIHGDGVNVAARLEGIAEPGGICISEDAHRQVVGRLHVGYVDLGEHNLRNIQRPMRAYRIATRPDESASKTLNAEELLRPDKPSIAVLPFDNLSGDPEQQYFSDGLSEDIITDLSKITDMFVIARNSSFVYRGKTVNVSAVSKELGVRYVLEGSVRRADNRVRVTAQLIDGDTDGHVWAERYDRDLSDIFTVQDEIVGEIVRALAASLNTDEAMRAASSTTDNMEAYDLFLRGRDLVLQQTQEANERSKPLLKRVIELRPNFAPAYTILAAPLIREYVNGWVEQPEISLAQSHEMAQQAVALDDSLPQAHRLLGLTLMWMKQLDGAAREVERAIKLEPNFADAYAALGQIYTYAGNPADAIEPLQTAMRLDPHYRDVFLHFLGQAHFMCGQYNEAIETLQRRLVRRPDTDITRVLLAASYGHLGLVEQARDQWAAVLQLNPSYSLEHRRSVLPFKDPADFEKIIIGLHKAGLPEDQDAKEAAPLQLPDKPSIAVLPFENMSGDPEQEYFSDGITEDLITDLAKISGLFVVAHNAVFLYKGKAVMPVEVSHELGVKYVLEGSVRKAGNRVRISAQLIDPPTGYHIWAERYDRDLTDIFALQDEITEKIVAALEVKLTAGEQEQVTHRYTENLEAYDYFLRGRAYQARSTQDSNSKAREMYERAIELDPNFAGAYAVLSHTHWRDWRNQWSEDSRGLERALESAKKAVALDGSSAFAHTYLAWVYVHREQYEEAVAEAKQAVVLDPGFAEGYARLGLILGFAGRPEDALSAIEKALQLDPHHPPSYILYLGTIYYALGRHEEALAALKKSLTRNPEAMGCNLWLAAVQSELGRRKEAQAQMAEVLRISPRASVGNLKDRAPYKDQVLLERYLAALHKAGLPE